MTDSYRDLALPFLVMLLSKNSKSKRTLMTISKDECSVQSFRHFELSSDFCGFSLLVSV